MTARLRLGATGYRVSFGFALAVLATGAALCPAGSGAHSPGHYFLRAHRAIRFQVHGSHGYTIGVAEASRGHFRVTVRRGPSTTEYELRGTRHRPEPGFAVRGSLGKLGSFEVRFSPRGRSHQLPRYSWCTGPGPTIQPGIVRGKIRFRGERGYTRIVARLASAELETLPAQRCHYGELGHSKHPPRYTAILDADREMRGLGIHLEALRFAPGSRPPAHRAFYEAAAYEDLGQVRIVRSIRIATDTSGFRLPGFARAPEAAVIQPPAPFTGSATFGRTAESTFSWTGDLAVEFPGIDPVALAGPAFHLHYCALRSCVDQESQEERAKLP